MPTSTSRPGPRLASWIAGALVLTTCSMLLSATLPERRIVYVSPITAPAGMSPEDVRLAPTPLDIRAAFRSAVQRVDSATVAGGEALPPIPWGRHGLANVPLDLDARRWDPLRSRYIVDLEGGRVAVLTLHGPLQQHMERTLAQYREPGQAAVVIEPSTGRVLAMADLTRDDALPADLARRANAWAASVFKVITGAALLLDGHIDPQHRTCFAGGGSGFTMAQLHENAARDTDCVTFTQAMGRSANIVFGRLALRHLTPGRLTEVAERFGFNVRIPFELPVDVSRVFLPEEPLEFARAAAGFRYSTLSPLHGALMQAAIANEGVMMVPTLVERIEDRSGQVVYEHNPTVWRVALPRDVSRMVRETQTTTCVTGTARSYFAQRRGWPTDIDAWGKTGTLANRRIDGTQPDPYFLQTWFTGVGRLGDRELAAAGLVHNTPTWWIRGSFLASEALLQGLRMTTALDVAGAPGGDP